MAIYASVLYWRLCLVSEPMMTNYSIGMISLRVVHYLTLAVVIDVLSCDLSNHPAIVFVGVLLTLIVVNWVFGRLQQDPAKTLLWGTSQADELGERVNP